MLILITKNSIVLVEGSLSNCPFSCHPMIAISRGGFFVPRGRLSECSKDGFTKHLTTLPDFATAETKFSLCERGHVVNYLPATGVNELYPRTMQQRSSQQDIASDKNNETIKIRYS
jgi:hypothetical protein